MLWAVAGCGWGLIVVVGAVALVFAAACAAWGLRCGRRGGQEEAGSHLAQVFQVLHVLVWERLQCTLETSQRQEREKERESVCVCVHFLLCVYVCAVSESKGENDSGSSEKAFNSLVVFDRSLVVKGGEGEEGDDFDELSTVACNNLVFLEVS